MSASMQTLDKTYFKHLRKVLNILFKEHFIKPFNQGYLVQQHSWPGATLRYSISIPFFMWKLKPFISRIQQSLSLSLSLLELLIQILYLASIRSYHSFMHSVLQSE